MARMPVYGARPASSLACRASRFRRSTAAPSSASPSRRSSWRNSAPHCTAARASPARCSRRRRCWPARRGRAEEIPAGHRVGRDHRHARVHRGGRLLGTGCDPAGRDEFRRRLAAGRAEELCSLDGHTAHLILVVARSSDGLSLFAFAGRCERAGQDGAADAGRDAETRPARLRRRPGHVARLRLRRAAVSAASLDVASIALAIEAARRRRARAGDGGRLRQAALSVRPADRLVPGDQTPLRRPAARDRVAARGGVLRRRLPSRRTRPSWRSRPRWPRPTRRTSLRTSPRRTSRSTAGSASPGSTTRTCTSSGRRRASCFSATPATTGSTSPLASAFRRDRGGPRLRGEAVTAVDGADAGLRSGQVRRHELSRHRQRRVGARTTHPCAHLRGRGSADGPPLPRRRGAQHARGAQPWCDR